MPPLYQVIRPFELLNNSDTEELERSWKPALNEIRKVWLEDPNERLRIRGQLVLLSNLLYRENHQHTSKLLRRHLTRQVEGLIIELNRLDPIFRKQVQVTDFSLLTFRLKVRKHLNRISNNTVGEQNCLINVFYKSLQAAVKSDHLTYCQTDYIINLLMSAEKCIAVDTVNLDSWLLNKGFNAPGIINEFINRYQKTLEILPGLYEQLEFLMMEQTRIINHTFSGDPRYFADLPSLKASLQNYLQAKIIYIEQRIRQRREELNDELLKRSDNRLRINLPVAQFGLLIRLFLEKGLLLKDHIGDTFSFFSRNFFSPQTQYISADSLQKKSSDVEFATAQKLKAILISMINWLNEHYKLADY